MKYGTKVHGDQVEGGVVIPPPTAPKADEDDDGDNFSYSTGLGQDGDPDSPGTGPEQWDSSSTKELDRDASTEAEYECQNKPACGQGMKSWKVFIDQCPDHEPSDGPIDQNCGDGVLYEVSQDGLVEVLGEHIKEPSS